MALNGKRMKVSEIITELNILGGKHGIGIVDIVENRVVGMKSYNSPVVKEARLSLYILYGEVVPCLMILPLYNFIFTSPVMVSSVD